MLPNIDRNLYARFKQEGYRKKQYAGAPVRSLSGIVQLAYLDVCRTISHIEPQQAQLFTQTVESCIVGLLSQSPETQEAFDLLHHEGCQQCTTASAIGKVRIHYGQAQKLMNMSFKYLYNEFAVYYGQLNQFGFPDNNVEQFFHLPIDNQILTYLLDNCDFCSATSLPWSKWSYDHYINFQSQLRNRLCRGYKPLEIDYLLWNTNGASVGNAITRRA